MKIFIVLFFSFANIKLYSQIETDTFKVITTNNGINQLFYPGKITNSYALLGTPDFKDKLITCIAGKYLLDSVVHLLDSATVINKNSYLEIRRTSKTGMEINTLLDVEIIDKKRNGSKARFTFEKREPCEVNLENGRAEIESTWPDISNGMRIGNKDLGFVKLECWLISDCNKVEFKKYIAKSGKRYKDAGLQGEKTTKFIPILTNNPDKGWQIFFLFHDNYTGCGFIFNKTYKLF